MDKREFLAQLKQAGVEVDQALNRFMGNEDLYLSFLVKLPEKIHSEEILRALETGDEDNFYLMVHNLKGMAANLGLTPIQDSAQAILVEFRSSRFEYHDKLSALTQEVAQESAFFSELIRSYVREGETK